MASKTIVLITGGNTGIGLETVKALLGSASSYHIILGSRSLDKANTVISTLKSTFGKTSSTIEPIQIDVTSDESIIAAFDQTKSKHGKLDTLINNAGASFDAEVSSGRMSMRQAWNAAYDVNVTGAQITTYAFMPLLIKSSDARIIFVTSGLSTLEEASSQVTPNQRAVPAGWPKPPEFSFASYRSSKTALNMMMLEWTRTVKEDGVKVWCISPGFLATGLGGDAELLKKMGAGDPTIGGDFIKDVVEGKRDGHTGKVIRNNGVIQPW